MLMWGGGNPPTAGDAQLPDSPSRKQEMGGLGCH